MISVRAATTSSLLAATAVGGSIAVTPFIAGFPALAGQSARYALAAVALVTVLDRLDPARTGRRPTRRQLARLTLAAATGSAGFNVLLIAASRHAEPAAIGAVVGVSPVVLAVLGAPRTAGRLPRPRPNVLAGAVLATIGVVVLQGGGRSSTVGLLLAAGVLACEVAFTLVAAPLLPALGAARVSVWSCALAAGLLGSACLVVGEPLRVPTRLEAGTLLYQGLVMTAVAFVLWYRGVERLGPDRAGVTMAAAPLAAAGVAALVGTGSLGVRTVVGAALVAAAVALALRPSSGPSMKDPVRDVSTPVTSHSS
jgi:drug/metabolite transporter (DMT)-like permease